MISEAERRFSQGRAAAARPQRLQGTFPGPSLPGVLKLTEAFCPA